VKEELSPTPKEEQGSRVLETKVLRKVFVLKREELTGGWRKFIICTPYQILLG
jgi:hypothetical protein